MASPEFIAAFREKADANGMMSFARFMDLALYHPGTGYYVKRRRRIGRAADADFFTAASSGPVFGELVAAACADLLGQQPPDSFTFVEIGAETVELSKLACPSETVGRARPLGAPSTTDGPAVRPYHQADSPALQGGGSPSGVLAPGTLESSAVTHPFGAVRTISLGQPLAIPPNSIVFSNELFDAQPCHRLLRIAERWQETGVALKSGALDEVLMPGLSIEVQAVQHRLPASAPDGYRIDLPLAAARLATEIATEPWAGLFVAIDYGKSWLELSEDTPAGTVRAYSRHHQSNDLLARPGEQDLTCHICWDWIADALTAHGFEPPALESQEAFFVHHAALALSRLTAAEAVRLSSRKLSVMQLLHPGNMGRKFQVLWAQRRQPPIASFYPPNRHRHPELIFGGHR
jgi:SAM-dependent MidA family methyltransferase